MVTFLVHYFREGYDSDWTDEEVELEFEDPADCRKEEKIRLHLQSEGFYEADNVTTFYDKNKYFNHRWYGKKTIRVPKLESESESDEEDEERICRYDFRISSDTYEFGRGQTLEESKELNEGELDGVCIAAACYYGWDDVDDKFQWKKSEDDFYGLETVTQRCQNMKLILRSDKDGRLPRRVPGQSWAKYVESITGSIAGKGFDPEELFLVSNKSWVLCQDFGNITNVSDGVKYAAREWFNNEDFLVEQ